MRIIALFTLVTAVAGAATIRGTVVENLTGKALSRAAVDLLPVPGTGGMARSGRTGLNGSFEFLNVAPGAYLVKSRRRGFMPAEHGQKRWNSAGTPVKVLSPNDSVFATIRLFRYGAITGAVFDENDIGLPQQEVIAYRNTQPPQMAARGTTDDRGVYRISGLEPGEYIARSAGYVDGDSHYAPTFAKQTLQVEQAYPVQVFADEDARDVDLRPLRGRLFTLRGSAEPSPRSLGPVNITLSSDMGRVRAVGPTFTFESLPPGRYELTAEVAGPPHQSAFASFSLGSDMIRDLSLAAVRESRIEVDPTLADIQVFARRRDLAGPHDAQLLKITNNRAVLSAGRWELMLLPPGGQYVSTFSGPSMNPAERGRPDGWNELTVYESAAARFGLTGGSAVIQGVVKSTGEVVAGAPVYLEAYDPNTGQRLLDLRTVITDLQGAYRFDSIAPGTYRILSTFEYANPDPRTMDTTSTRSLRVEPRGSLQTDLDLYVIR